MNSDALILGDIQIKCASEYIISKATISTPGPSSTLTGPANESIISLNCEFNNNVI